MVKIVMVMELMTTPMLISTETEYLIMEPTVMVMELMMIMTPLTITKIRTMMDYLIK